MKLTKLLFYLFLISIPFGTRVLVHQFTTGFHEYEAIFIYAGDILMILFLISTWLRNTETIQIYRFSFPYICTKSVFCSLMIFLFLAAISVFFALSKGLAIYNFIRLLLLVLMAFAMAKVLREGIVKLENVFAIIAGSAVFQSLLALAQFIKQGSLGLAIFGEPFLNTEMGGVAKIAVEGAKILRAYGTFPHPNVLGAFLILGLCSFYYLWLQNTEKIRIYRTNVALSIGIFIVSLGLLLTFSRTAWLIAVAATLAVVIFFRNWKLAILAAAIFYILYSIFSPYVLSRAKISPGEPAVSYRLTYNQLGLDLVKNNPLGVGIGNQVLYSVKNDVYQKFGMNEAWQWQPIHNIYLLIASEIGILGLITFLIFVGRLLISHISFLISTTMFTSLLLFGLVDHFLWTLQPGRLMLWLVIGLVMFANKKTDSMSRLPGN